MTQKIGVAGEASAASLQPIRPAGIEGCYDEAISIVGLLDVISRSTDCDTAIVACFEDTKHDAAKRIFHRPFIGIRKAALRVASQMRACGFRKRSSLRRKEDELKRSCRVCWHTNRAPWPQNL